MQQGHTLFVLQNELIDKKVEVAVINHIAEFRQELHDFRNEVRQEFMEFRLEMRRELHDIRLEFGTRLTAVEVALGMRLGKQAEVRQRFLDYSFKAGWIILGGVIASLSSFFADYLHTLVK